MLAQFSESLQQLVAKVSPAVVQIEVSGFRPAVEDNRKGVNQSVMVREDTIGAGVIVDSDGYIMTNAHVVAGAQRIRVILPAPAATLFEVSGVRKAQVLDAEIIGSQPTMDLALLKVKASGLPCLHFDLKRIPQTGELVFAIGSPEGLQNSVSMGVVSSAWRQPYPDNPMVFLQTDAPINPGNSGGPLVDVKGAVVGINTFILSSSGGNQGLGFAIPAGIVDFVYHSLRDYGYVRHIEIGALAQTITPTLAEGLGLEQNWGVIISDIVPGGPADAAGIHPGDIVTCIDDQPVQGLPGFVAALYQHLADRDVRISVLRGTQKLSFSVASVLVRDRSEQLVEVADPVKSQIGRLGILAVDLDDQVRSLLPARLGTGVVVAGREQGADSVDTGLLPGDIIHSLNRTFIVSLEQLRTAVSHLRIGDPVVLQIERTGQFQYLAFQME
jgi:serine protease Do